MLNKTIFMENIANFINFLIDSDLPVFQIKNVLKDLFTSQLIEDATKETFQTIYNVLIKKDLIFSEYMNLLLKETSGYQSTSSYRKGFIAESLCQRINGRITQKHIHNLMDLSVDFYKINTDCLILLDQLNLRICCCMIEKVL